MPSTSTTPPPPTFPPLTLSSVNKHDIWDVQESAISNPSSWRALLDPYYATPDFLHGIPLKIHQIWIGPRQPPCVWLDTWRIDFMSAFKTAPPSDDWRYYLWDNHSVVGMPMKNRHLFDAEPAPQCQADILRLEVLYNHGGVYIDADIVSTVRDLRPVLESAKKTGFVITYEPDTNDKPYSILGNSIIAATPRHPLVLMLMAYISKIYKYKRPYYGVEWVTGPLTYTKVLVNTNMPITVPPSDSFYPAFHYVPNPSAIDLTKLDSYCFQFGYTCSGLAQWVADNNRCKKAHACPFHAAVHYPLGALKQFPPTISTCHPNADITNVIHQFAFSDNGPQRWADTWQHTFCPNNGYRYERWTWDRLRKEIGHFYCANLYHLHKLDHFSIHMLALEIMDKFGGYYVPLTTVFTGKKKDAFHADGPRFQSGSILGFAPGAALETLKKCYDTGQIVPSAYSPPSLSYVSDMGYSDAIAAFAQFKDGSRFLGAGEIYHVTDDKPDTGILSSANAALAWAYDCQVPVFRHSENAATAVIRESGKRVVVITDAMFAAFPSLINEIPGVMYRLDEEAKDWDFIVLNMEWEVDGEGLDVYAAASPFKAPTARYLGFIANTHASKDVISTNIETILERHGTGKVYVASEKSRHSAKVSSIYRTMALIEHACLTLANYTPNFTRDCDEVQDNLLKGLRGGQVGFELQVDDEQRVMFRSWNKGSIDCECKVAAGVNGLSVEFLRCFEDGKVVHDIAGTVVR